jgi:hypothetical protein
LLPEDHARFRDIASAIQSIVVAAGVIVGGLWAGFTCGALEQSNRARRELERLSRELMHQPNLRLSMTARSLHAAGSAARYIDIEVKAENLGNRPTRIEFGAPPLTIHNINQSADGTTSFAEVGTFSPLPHTGNPEVTRKRAATIAPAAVETLTFLARVPQAGLYWIVFAFPTTQDELSALRETGLPEGNRPEAGTISGSGLLYRSD